MIGSKRNLAYYEYMFQVSNESMDFFYFLVIFFLLKESLQAHNYVTMKDREIFIQFFCGKFSLQHYLFQHFFTKTKYSRSYTQRTEFWSTFTPLKKSPGVGGELFMLLKAALPTILGAMCWLFFYSILFFVKEQLCITRKKNLLTTAFFFFFFLKIELLCFWLFDFWKIDFQIH